MEFILQKIKEYKRIIIFGHVRPDGDCIGSQYGLKNLITETFPDKEVYVSGEVSESISFIGRPEFVDDSLFKGALGICVDIATGERVSDQRFKNCDYTIKIDHHINVDHFCDYEYVEEHSPACCEILTKFYIKFKNELKLSLTAAKALYVGIVTDTGRFKFDSVKAETFNAAAVLVDRGVDLGEIDNFLSVESINTLKLKGHCLENFKISKNGFAYIVMTRDIINKFGVSDEDAASMVTMISTIKGCPVWAMFIEYPTEIRVRLRSRGPQVNLLAAQYGGGGHAKASGARLKEWNELDKFVTDADNLVYNYKKENNLE